jgi:hypothetical protein
MKSGVRRLQKYIRLAEKPPHRASQAKMKLQPDSDLSNYLAAEKLKGKTAIITGSERTQRSSAAIVNRLRFQIFTSALTRFSHSRSSSIRL